METDEVEKCFIKIVKRKSSLPIPREFLEKFPEAFEEGQIVLQKNPGSKPWRCHFNREKESVDSGWREFCQGKKLERGNVILFRLVQGSIFSYDLYDTNGWEKREAVVLTPPLAPLPLGVKLEPSLPSLPLPQAYVSNSESSGAEEEPSGSQSGSGSPKSIEAIYNRPYVMYICTPHHLSFPSSREAVVFEDCRGRKWFVSWNPAMRQLTKGLVAFVRGNKVELGDRFKIFRVKAGHFKVEIVKGSDE